MRISSGGNPNYVDEMGEDFEIHYQEPPESYFGKLKRNLALHFGFLISLTVMWRVPAMEYIDGIPILKLGDEIEKRGINPSGKNPLLACDSGVNNIHEQLNMFKTSASLHYSPPESSWHSSDRGPSSSSAFTWTMLLPIPIFWRRASFYDTCNKSNLQAAVIRLC
ncbi:unnamed protein product [Fraxinus pennsylvanica]|uniref:Uncharacterized protein n=1 Tax=Fraxinus pennsylvanica TaxID=56036 RepID=A0AAD1YWE2_9LAMI|nr:unnamed protein product [Fraxinus pennsylvanica]